MFAFIISSLRRHSYGILCLQTQLCSCSSLQPLLTFATQSILKEIWRGGGRRFRENSMSTGWWRELALPELKGQEELTLHNLSGGSWPPSLPMGWQASLKQDNTLFLPQQEGQERLRERAGIDAVKAQTCNKVGLLHPLLTEQLPSSSLHYTHRSHILSIQQKLLNLFRWNLENLN